MALNFAIFISGKSKSIGGHEYETHLGQREEAKADLEGKFAVSMTSDHRHSQVSHLTTTPLAKSIQFPSLACNVSE